MRKWVGLVVIAVLVTACHSAPHPSASKPTTTLSTRLAPVDTLPGGAISISGSNTSDPTTTTTPRGVSYPSTTTTDPNLLANVNYWQGQMNEASGPVQQDQRNLSSDQGAESSAEQKCQSDESFIQQEENDGATPGQIQTDQGEATIDCTAASYALNPVQDDQQKLNQDEAAEAQDQTNLEQAEQAYRESQTP
jgi:hypothetical protein